MTVRIGFALLTLCLAGLTRLEEASAQSAPELAFEVDEIHVQLASGTLFEDFNAYPLQTHTASGGVEPSVDVTNSAGERIVTVSEGLVTVAGIASGGVGRTLSIETGAGESDFSFLVIADFPGFGPTASGGPFAVLQTPGRPDFSPGFSFAAGVRQARGTAATHFSFLIGDLGDPNIPDSGAEIFSRSFPLSSFFQTFSATEADFSVFEGEGPIDLTKIFIIGLEFFIGGTIDQCLLGDVDGNTEVNIADVARLRRILAGLPVP